MSQEWKAPAAEDDVQMPLGVGGGDAVPSEEYAAGPKIRVNTSTLALVAAFAAALVVLYFLGLQNKPRAASAEDAARAQATTMTIDDWIKNRTGQMKVEGLRSPGERLISVLDKYFGNKGGLPELLPDDPFKRPEAAAPVVIGPTETFIPKVGDPVDPQLVEAAKVFAGLKLQMIMLGQPSSALINNQMANVGTHFEPLVVSDIKSDRVILSYKDRSFELKSAGSQAGHP